MKLAAAQNTRNLMSTIERDTTLLFGDEPQRFHDMKELHALTQSIAVLAVKVGLPQHRLVEWLSEDFNAARDNARSPQ
jgi:hypothetical protein